MERTLKESVTLTKTVSGYIRAVRSADTGEWTVPIYCEDDETWYYSSGGQYASGAHVDDLTIYIYNCATDDVLLSMTLGIAKTLTPESLGTWTDCPEDSYRYDVGGFANYSVKLDWSATLGGIGGADTVGGAVLAKQYYNAFYTNAWGSEYGWNFDDPPDPYGDQIEHPAYAENDPSEDIEYDETLAYELSITGTFDIKAKYSGELDSGTDFIYHAYPNDRDPYGITPRELEVYYVPHSGSSVSVSLEIDSTEVYSGSVDASDYADEAAFNAAFKNGFGKVLISADVVKTYDSAVYTARDFGEMLEAVVTGMPNAGTQTITESVEETNGSAYWTPSATGGTYSIESSNSGYAHQIVFGPGASNTTYNALITDWEGTVRSGVQIGVAEYGAADHRGGAGTWAYPVVAKTDNVIMTTGGLGTDQVIVYHPGDLRGFDDSVLMNPNTYYVQHPTGTGARRHNASDIDYEPQQGIINLDSLNEPLYDATETESAYGDWRCELYPSYVDGTTEKFIIEDVLTVDAPTSADKTIFATHTNWSVTAGSADITDDGTTIIVDNITSDATISGNCSGFTFRGARFADLVHTSDSTDPLTITIGGCTWQVTAADTEFDLASPETGAAASSTSQTQITGTPDWGWGVGTVGTMTIAGLKVGKTYTFTKVTLKRKSKLKAVIFAGAFIGDAEGATRASDTYTMHNFWTRKGLVFCDGMPAAEIRETHHINTSGVWTHEYACTDDADVISPADGFVTWNHSADADLEALYLLPGTYEEATLGSGIALDARLYGVDVLWPYNLGACTLNIWKRFRGGVAVGLASPSGASTSGITVTVYYGATSSGAWTELGTVTTDSNGLAFTAGLQQTIAAGAKFYKLEANTESVVVQVRNRNISLARLIGDWVSGLLYDQSTGYLHYCTDGKLEYAE